MAGALASFFVTLADLKPAKSRSDKSR
jgi:hypothetical protein